MRYGPVLLFFLASIECVAVGAQDKNEYQLKREVPTAGSLLRSMGATSPVPFDKSYSELTAIQQNALKAQYEKMGPGDEPPYPSHGTKQIWKSLIKVGDQYNERGTLSIIVDVSAEGTATKATVLKSPGEHVASYMSMILLKTQYKSAMCNSMPCAQQYKFDAQWVSN